MGVCSAARRSSPVSRWTYPDPAPPPPCSGLQWHPKSEYLCHNFLLFIGHHHHRHHYSTAMLSSREKLLPENPSMALTPENYLRKLLPELGFGIYLPNFNANWEDPSNLPKSVYVKSNENSSTCTLLPNEHSTSHTTIRKPPDPV